VFGVILRFIAFFSVMHGALTSILAFLWVVSRIVWVQLLLMVSVPSVSVVVFELSLRVCRVGGATIFRITATVIVLGSHMMSSRLSTMVHRALVIVLILVQGRLMV